MVSPSSDSPVKKPRPLTTKQRKYVKAKLEGKTGTQAAVEAYGVTPAVGSVISSENLNKPSIQQALDAAYERAGISIDSLVKPLADGLVANRVVQIEGDFYETDVPDHNVRIKSAGLAAQWLGVGKQTENTPVSVHFHSHTDNKKQAYAD